MVEQRYRVVERLEAGGMAEVFRGEALSVQGFRKQVAIKRVLPHLAENKNFIAMFLDEARLGARLNHANIVTVFDIGAADNTFFIVMEFIEGCNLKAVIEYHRETGLRIPIAQGIYICMEACRGLSYAHELTDDESNALSIVHRDISPPNILLSKRGETKVTDFGLAKATTQLEKTDPGVVKGKFSYLSPEAALGDRVDARADVFALGIVLWEMIAGRRLFLGETDFHTVRLVQQAEIPKLSRLNPKVDEGLEDVLATALAQDPNDRYQSAREFGDALAGYLFSRQLKVTSYDIAGMVKEVTAHRKKTKKAGAPSIIDQLIQEELLRFTSLGEDGDEPIPVEGNKPLSPDDVAAAKPLDPIGFENPADWFANDDEVGAAIGAAASTRPGWRESGIEDGGLANILEADDDPTVFGSFGALTPTAEAPPADPHGETVSQDAPTIAGALPRIPEPVMDASRGPGPTQPAVEPSTPKSKPPETAPQTTPQASGTSSRLGIIAGLVVVLLISGAAALWASGILP